MRAIVSVIGKDRQGLIAKVSGMLFEHGANIVDISQTVMQEFFTMIMLVEAVSEKVTISKLGGLLEELSKELGVEIRIQHEDIFNAMHRI